MQTPTTPSKGISPPDSATLDAAIGRALVRLAGSSTAQEVRQALELTAEALPGRAILVLFRSHLTGEADGEGEYEVIARAGGPIGVPSRVPWGKWGPADLARKTGTAGHLGPHPFGPCVRVFLGGPASQPPGTGLGLAVLYPSDMSHGPSPEELDLLVEAAETGLIRSSQMADLARLSFRDPLTGTLNRKALDEVLVREMKRASRPSNIKQTSLLMVDLDNFKEINDHHGHHAGDRILRAVAEAMTRVLRVEDIVARYGGDEFVLLLPETDAPGSLRVASKIRDVLSRVRVNSGGGVIGVTASIGAATDRGESATFDRKPTEEEKHALARRFAERIRRLMTGADAAAYAAKAAGRNAVRHSDPAANMPVPAVS